MQRRLCSAQFTLCVFYFPRKAIGSPLRPGPRQSGGKRQGLLEEKAKGVRCASRFPSPPSCLALGSARLEPRRLEAPRTPPAAAISRPWVGPTGRKRSEGLGSPGEGRERKGGGGGDPRRRSNSLLAAGARQDSEASRLPFVSSSRILCPSRTRERRLGRGEGGGKRQSAPRSPCETISGRKSEAALQAPTQTKT